MSITLTFKLRWFSKILSYFWEKRNACISEEVFHLQGGLGTTSSRVLQSALVRVELGWEPSFTVWACAKWTGALETLSWVWWGEQIVRRPAILTSKIFNEDNTFVNCILSSLSYNNISYHFQHKRTHSLNLLVSVSLSFLQLIQISKSHEKNSLTATKLS